MEPLSPITRRLGVSARLRALVECIPIETGTFVDVGTNHGILAIAAVKSGRARRSVAVDRSHAALADARRRLRRCHCEDTVALVHGDGFGFLDSHAIDVVCLAGIGGPTIASILAASLPHMPSGPTRILCNAFSPSAALTAILAEHGYTTHHLPPVTDRGRAYSILIADRAK